MKSPSTRLLMGVAALVCLIAGGVIFWQGGEANGSVLLRSGLVLGATWLAWPLIVRVDRRWFIPVIVTLLIAVTRPLLLVWVVPLVIVIGLLRRRSPSPDRRGR